MPYKSLAQEGYFHTHKAQLAKKGVSVSEWDKASKGLKLPKHISSKPVSTLKVPKFPGTKSSNLLGKVKSLK